MASGEIVDISLSLESIETQTAHKSPIEIAGAFYPGKTGVVLMFSYDHFVTVLQGDASLSIGRQRGFMVHLHSNGYLRLLMKYQGAV